VRNLLRQKVDCDRHVVEDSGSALGLPEHTTIDPVDGKRRGAFPAFKAPVGFNCELREVLFDCFGCALHLYLRLSACKVPVNLTLTICRILHERLFESRQEIGKKG
jgi:hypothetical protein